MDEVKCGPPPGLYAFDDQSKEDVVNLLKGDCEVQEKMKEKHHSPDCTCTWCQEDCKENTMKLLTPELPQKKGKVDPEVYAFMDQTKEQVKELIEKANKPNLQVKQRENCKHWANGGWADDKSAKRFHLHYQNVAEILHSQRQAEAAYPTRAGCPLIGETADGPAPFCGDEQPDIRKAAKSEDCRLNEARYEEVDESEDICQLGPLWRKLSGVRPKEHVYEDKTIDNLLDKIIIALERTLPEMEFAWSDDRCYNQVLLVNKAKTRFSTDPLIVAYEAVNSLAGKEESEEVIVSIIKKKVCSLFI